MARRRHHYRRLQKEAPELNITTFLNLMVVLVPFLLITAVFSRVTILELTLPTGGSSNADNKQQLTIEVIVREKGLEIGNGKQVLARFPLLKPEQVAMTATESGAETEEEFDPSKLYDLKLLSNKIVAEATELDKAGDEKRKKVTANYSITDNNMPIVTFGQDQRGEVYFTDA